MFYYYHWVDACAGGLLAGADPGFQVRGGGALKKIEPSGGRCKIFWVFRVKNHIFSNFRGGGVHLVHAPWICP